MNLGVLSNPTGVLGNLDHIVDSMISAGVRPAAAFGPEHAGVPEIAGSWQAEPAAFEAKRKPYLLYS